jgi:restriction system protein
VITARQPEDWRGLQRDVAAILDECGFAVEVEKTVQLARGQAALDVYAVESIGGRTYTIFCECKLWKSAIPQHVIHSFRTVVADGGANVGYVITSSAFQRGAFSAAERTNLRLVMWPEFQAEFESTWIDTCFRPQVTKRLDPLMTYTEPLLPRAFVDLDEDGKERFMEVRKRHIDLGVVAMMLTTYMQMLSHKVPDLPLRPRFTPSAVMPPELLDATGYRDLFEILMAAGEAAMAELREALGLPPDGPVPPDA